MSGIDTAQKMLTNWEGSGWSCKKDSESGKDALKQESEVVQSFYFDKKKVQNGLITVHKYLY